MKYALGAQLCGEFLIPGEKHDLAKLCKIAQTLSHHSFYNASVPDEAD
jgi:hypothetical protein